MCLYAYNKQTVLSITACVAAPRCERRFSSIATVHCCPRTWLLPDGNIRKISPCAGPLLVLYCTGVLNHRFYRLRNRDWKRCVSREWSVLRAKCILFDARLPGVRTKTLLLYRYRACGGCYSQIKVPDRRQ